MVLDRDHVSEESHVDNAVIEDKDSVTISTLMSLELSINVTSVHLQRSLTILLFSKACS